MSPAAPRGGPLPAAPAGRRARAVRAVPTPGVVAARTMLASVAAVRGALLRVLAMGLEAVSGAGGRAPLVSVAAGRAAAPQAPTAAAAAAVSRDLPPALMATVRPGGQRRVAPAAKVAATHETIGRAASTARREPGGTLLSGAPARLVGATGVQAGPVGRPATAHPGAVVLRAPGGSPGRATAGLVRAAVVSPVHGQPLGVTATDRRAHGPPARHAPAEPGTVQRAMATSLVAGRTAPGPGLARRDAVLPARIDRAAGATGRGPELTGRAVTLAVTTMHPAAGRMARRPGRAARDGAPPVRNDRAVAGATGRGPVPTDGTQLPAVMAIRLAAGGTAPGPVLP